MAPQEDIDKEKKKSIEKSFFKIDREMIRFKAHFFLFEGGAGSIKPFIPIVARYRLGLSATSLAAILTSSQLITIVTKPLIGYIVDYFNKLKLVICILLILQVVFLFLILAIPPIKKPLKPSQQLASSNQFKHLDTQSKFIIFNIEACWAGKDTLGETIFLTQKEEVNSKCTEFGCLNEINTTDMLCYQILENNSTGNFMCDSKLNCSCSIISSNVGNFSHFVQNYNGTQYYYLSSVTHQYSESSENKIFSCKFELIKDQEGSLETSAILEINEFLTLEFWMFAFVQIFVSICTSSLFTLSDTACVESVQNIGGDFGKQRLFGAIGWGIGAAVGGLLCDITNDYLAAWILMALLQMLTLWNISQLNLSKPHFSQNLSKDIGRVLKSLEFAAFELGVFFNGIGAGFIWSYLLWFLASLGASTFLCGFAQYIQCFLGEIPFMFFSGWLIKKLGYFSIISLSLVSYAIRFLWYSYLRNPWYVLPVEITHGITYGTLFPAIVTYGKLRAKPGAEATTQSILFTTHSGLGAGIGCIIAGICFDHIGTHQTFFYMSLFYFSATMYNIVNDLLLKKRNTKELKLTSVCNVKL